MRTLLVAALALSIAFQSAHAAEPAVSGFNAKLGGEGGLFDDESAGFAQGSIALPLGHALGLQVDGTLGAIDNELVGGGGAHLFTRDPSSYLLGVYGSYHTWDSIDVWRLAGEAELYLDRFTLTGLAGYEKLDVPSVSNGLDVLTQDSGHFFGLGDLAYYINDDFKVYAGYRYFNETSFGGAGGEYLFRGHDVPVSVFARGDFGSDEYTRITGGLRVYLSPEPQKSLIDRHRKDDPDIYMPVFPKLMAGMPQCQVAGKGDVVSPPNGQCLCPDGSGRPVEHSGQYYCSPS